MYRKVKIEVGWVFRVYGTIETTDGDGLKIVPTEAKYEEVLRRLGERGMGMRGEEEDDGDDAQFPLGLPQRLIGWMWADVLEPPQAR
jgi:hypothetical protein